MSRSVPFQQLRTRCCVALCLALFACGQSHAAIIQMKDGRQLNGRIGKTAGLADDPLTGGTDTKTITFIDDDLRRVYFPAFQIRAIDEVDAGENRERISIPQQVAKSGSRVNRMGPVLEVKPFDKYGRRTFSMNSTKGELSVIQGITQITPVWTKVEGLLTKSLHPVVWDMRIATSSIPRDTLHTILANNVKAKTVDQRLRVVRLFIQSERYQDAQKELEEVIADFPQEKDLLREVQALKQLHARSILKEIDVRRRAGQHDLAFNLLEKFPTQDVAGETLQQSREMSDEYREMHKKITTIHSELKAQASHLKDPKQKAQAEELMQELERELGPNTLDRMATYLRLLSDPELAEEQKLSLALSSWLLGGDQAETNLAVTLSLLDVRRVIYQYMNEPVQLNRTQLETQLRALEGSSPLLVARLIGKMKPSLETPAPSRETPGYYTLTVPVGIDKEPDVTYHVQLPPQYDPYVRYPTIVTLNGEGSTAEQQVDWWAGAFNDNGQRVGQATRRGYIVIAVDWMKEGQHDYEFSAREHAAVLASLRDACRRFSVNTDRVFLSGHSTGGNAAWDLGLAHPDLWAGVLPIVARSQKYCSHYWQNAKLVPFYVLLGELDGEMMKQNAKDLDRYMMRRYDVTVVEYQGRGHEDFYEDIQNIFDWIEHRADRDFFPKEFTVSTMRPWDNFFWWLEVTKFPERAMIEPSDWPPARGVRAAELKAKVLASGDVTVNTSGIRATVWLAAEVADPNRPPITVTVAGKSTKVNQQPDLTVLLEDVRTRGDRQHPFWAKVSL